MINEADKTRVLAWLDTQVERKLKELGATSLDEGLRILEGLHLFRLKDLIK